MTVIPTPLVSTFTDRDDKRGFNLTIANISLSPIHIVFVSPAHGVQITNSIGKHIRCGSEFAPRHYGPFEIAANSEIAVTYFLAGLFECVAGTFTAIVVASLPDSSSGTRTIRMNGQISLDLPTLNEFREEIRERQQHGQYETVRDFEVLPT